MRILFVSHEASATGAPLFLLNFIRWLKHHGDQFKCEAIILKDGVLLSEWEKEIPCTLLQPTNVDENIHRLQNCIGKQWDLVYFNSIETAHVLNFLQANEWFGSRPKVVLHTHELEGIITKYGVEKVRQVAQSPDIVIAASEAVRQNYIVRHGFASHKIHTIHSGSRSLSDDQSKTGSEDSNVKKLGTPMVLSCGETIVVKGPDLFIQTAAIVNRIAQKQGHTPIQFQWLGRDTHGMQPYYVNDAYKLGVAKQVSFVGEQRDVGKWFRAADIFFLSSREDSCPLVCLEAASLGLPIVYFKGSGGMDEILGDWAGYPVDYMDTHQAAQTIFDILKRPRMSDERCSKALQIYNTHHTVDVVYNKLLKLLSSLTKKPKC